MLKTIIFQIFLILTKNSLRTKINEPTSNQYCISLDDQLNCKICAMSYLTSEKTCSLPSTLIPKCIQYSSSKVCSRCIFGYSPNQEGFICEKIKKKDCYIINRQKDCTACKRDIGIKDGDCEKENKIPIKNCSVFSGNEDFNICNMCDEGFTIFTEDISHSSCVRESGDINNCWYLENKSKEFCDTCNFNYYMGKDRICRESEVYNVDIYSRLEILVILSFFLFKFF